MGIEIVMAIISVSVLLACLCNPKLNDRLREDRKYATMCAHLVKRISKLVPVYKKVTEEYSRLVVNTVGVNQALNHIAEVVPAETKQKAERDFCVQDAGHIEAVSMLQMQLAPMINANNSISKEEVKDV
jgi:hypothetical protein